MFSVKRVAKRALGGTRLWRSLCVGRYHLRRMAGDLRLRYRTSSLVHRLRDLFPSLVYRRIQTPRFYDGFYFDAPKDPWQCSGYGGEYVDVEDFRQLAVQVRDLLGARTALDVGCAKGFLVRALRREGVNAWGADLSEYAIAAAPEEVRPWLTVGRCQELPFPDSSFEAVILMETLEHVPPGELDRTVAEIRRLSSRWALATIPALRVTAFGPDHALGPELHPRSFYEPMVDLTPFRSLERDRFGYPLHGHVTIASQDFWTALFSRHGFARRWRMEVMVREAVDTMRKGDWIPFVFERAPDAAEGKEAKPLIRDLVLEFRKAGGIWYSQILRLPAGRHFLRLKIFILTRPPREEEDLRCLHARAISLDGETMHGACILSRREVRKATSGGRLALTVPLALPEEGEVMLQLQGEPDLFFTPAAVAALRVSAGPASSPVAPVLIPFPARSAGEVAVEGDAAADDRSFSRRKLAL